jgi:predicted transcriptional regulator
MRAELAEAIGTSQSAIARMEDGDYPNRTLSTLV